MNQQAKFSMITEKTLVIGVDIAKSKHWARCHNYRGEPVTKPFPFQNNKFGFQSLVQRLENTRKNKGFFNIVLGVEPTGHYWKCLAYALRTTRISLVLVNPAHVKRSKELDDNSPTKNDPKDAGVIARLVKDARFQTPYLPCGIYADLRNLVNLRYGIVKKMTRAKLQLHTLVDTYFPEFFTTFKKIDSVTAMATLRGFPLPHDILSISDEEIKTYWRQFNKSSFITNSLVQKLKLAARNTIGVKEGQESSKFNFQLLMSEWDLLSSHLNQVEQRIENVLMQINYASALLSIKGVGIFSLAAFLSETGDLNNYKHWKQLRKLGGLNLVEKSSGNKQSGFKISKRGRRKLRATLYLIVLSLVKSNSEFKQMHNDLKTRSTCPLTGNESLVALMSKFLRIAHTLAKKGCEYDPSKVLPMQSRIAA